jgi:hypothetical protein
MAEGLDRPRHPAARSSEEPAGRLPAAAGVVGRGSERRNTPHASKFAALTTTLVVIALSAIGVAVVLVSKSNDRTVGPKWSTWSPRDDGVAGASEIANHLAPLYRISGTDQLAVVTVMKVDNSNLASSGTGTTSVPNGLQVAVRTDPSSSNLSLLSGSTIAYNICGIGSSNCTIGVGTPSANRLLLLRREALELALYSFKYLHGVQNVVALLPPGHPVTTSRLTPNPPPASSNAKATTPTVNAAVLFVKDELKPWLSEPLGATLSSYPPAVPQLNQWHNTEEAALVDQLTAHALFTSKVETDQAGDSLLVLNQAPPS